MALVMKNLSVSIHLLLICYVYEAFAQDPAKVLTEPQVNARLGSRVELPCEITVIPHAVYWSKGVPTSTESSLVFLDKTNTIGERSGKGYESGTYNITDNYSLVIHNVTMDMSDRFYCEVSEDKTGELFLGQTNVTVYVHNQSDDQSGGVTETMTSPGRASGNHSVTRPSPIIDSHSMNAGIIVVIVIVIIVIIVGGVVLCLCLARRKKRGFRDSVRREKKGGVNGQTDTGADSSAARQRNNNQDRGPAPKQSNNNQEEAVPLTCVTASVEEPPNQITETDPMMRLAIKLTGRHYKRLKNVCTQLYGSMEKTVQENNDVLFDTQRMITDYMYDKGYNDVMLEEMIKEAAVPVGRTDLCQETEVDGVSDSELHELVKYLTPAMASQLFEKLGIKQDGDIDVYDQLRKWRDESSKEMPRYIQRDKIFPVHEPICSVSLLTDDELELLNRHVSCPGQCKEFSEGTGIKHVHKKKDKQSELLKADLKAWRDDFKDDSRCTKSREALLRQLRKLDRPSLLPQPKGPHVYKAELVEVAFNILMQDIVPIARQLGISEEKMVSYRKEFHPSHLNRGTIRIILQLFESTDPGDNEREAFYPVLMRAGYIHVARTFLFGYDISFSELWNISDELLEGSDPLSEPNSKTTGTEVTGDGQTGHTTKRTYLQKVLRLSSDEVEHAGQSSNKILKYWKSKIRDLPFYYRAALAEGLADDVDLKRAQKIFAGHFSKLELNDEFIEEVMDKLDGVRILDLLQIVTSEETEIPGDRASKQANVRAQLTKWIHQRWKNMHDFELSEKFRAFNDRLVENGFHDLAVEVMIIEQPLWNASCN